MIGRGYSAAIGSRRASLRIESLLAIRITVSTLQPDPYLERLDTPKNLSGHALAEAPGLVHLRNPEGTVRTWCERSEIDALFEAGWPLV